MRELLPSVLSMAAGFFLASMPLAAVAQSRISAIWANDGGDKVLAEERRASGGLKIVPANGVRNTIFDGNRISLFGARNERVAFNLILESVAGATDLAIKFDLLEGPDGFSIG